MYNSTLEAAVNTVWVNLGFVVLGREMGILSKFQKVLEIGFGFSLLGRKIGIRFTGNKIFGGCQHKIRHKFDWYHTYMLSITKNEKEEYEMLYAASTE
jgi:hypothetical protein